MKLEDLNAYVTESYLVFDCPCGKCGGRIRVNVGPEFTNRDGRPVWQMTGSFPNLTLNPSINAGCWHGHIVDGEIQTC
jgi:Family of unknown function (DUF6527)